MGDFPTPSGETRRLTERLLALSRPAQSLLPLLLPLAALIASAIVAALARNR